MRLPSQQGMTFRDLNPDDKPREKALRLGVNALSDAELLAILLGSGTTGKSVLDLAHEILYNNSLANLSRMSIAEISRKYRGVGPAKATLLVAAMAFGDRCRSARGKKSSKVGSSVDAYEYMAPHLSRLNYEEFWVLHLNHANTIQFVEQLSKGTISSTSVDIRLLAKSAIDHLSSGVILVHNHPSGNLVPSPQDDTLTRRIQEVARLIDVKVFDHLIIGPSSYYSYADEGRL